MTPLLCVVLLICIERQALAQCRIEGTVRAANGAPIAGAVVRVHGPELRSTATATTDAAGRYAVADIPPGIRVQVMAVQQNGRIIARTITLVTLRVETVDLQGLPDSSAPMSAEDLSPQGGPSADVRGVVRSADGTPVAGAQVAISDTTVVTTTDSAGRFAFADVRAGIGLELGVSAGGFTPARAKVVVPGGGHTNANFVLELASEASAAEAGPSVVDTAEDQPSVRLRDADVARLPILARNDLFRALQFLPAVSAAAEVSSELYVRGGTPDQTGISYDGFTVYPVPHLFGTFSAVNMDAIEHAEFSPTAIEAAHGGHLAGALRLTGASGPAGKPSGAVDFSLLGWATKVSVPLGSRGSVLLAGRRSPPSGLYNDVLDYFYDTDTDAARDRTARFSGGPFGTLAATPSFYDLNGKLQLNVTAHDSLSVSLYNARDLANTSHDIPLPARETIDVPDPVALPADAVAQISSIATWRGRGSSVVWQRQWSPSATTLLSVGRSQFSNDADVASLIASPSTNVDYSFVGGRGGSQAVSERNEIGDTTVRVVNTIRFGFEHAVSAGAEVASLDATYRASTEVVTAAAPAGVSTSTLVDLLHRTSEARAITVFAQDAWRPLARLTIAPGVRVVRYDLAGSTYFDPRVNATYLLRPQIRVTGGFTIDHQLANRITREDLIHGDSTFWTLADGAAIPVPRSRQGFVGAAVVLPGFHWSAHGYYKILDDLTILAPRLFPGVAPEAASSLSHHGSGRSMGVESLVQHENQRNTIWASVAFGRTEYTYPTLQSATFLASHDRRAELKISDTLRFGRSWSAGAVFVAAGGRPETRVRDTEPVWFPSGDARYQIVFGSKNSARLPAYHRLDLSGQRDFRFGAATATLGATLFNVYDRQNIAYTEHELAATEAISHEVMLMRRAANVFVRFRF